MEKFNAKLSLFSARIREALFQRNKLFWVRAQKEKRFLSFSEQFCLEYTYMDPWVFEFESEVEGGAGIVVDIILLEI